MFELEIKMIVNRLEKLRKLMKNENIAAYIIQGTDPHQSEYVPKLWMRREFMSGFTGSAGDLVVLKEKAGLWTDSRYFIQAKLELAGSGIDLFKMGQKDTPSQTEWIISEINSKDKVGIDPALLTFSGAKKMQSEFSLSNISMKSIEENLVDMVWDDQPTLPLETVAVWPDKYAGESVEQKLGKIREHMVHMGVEIHVLSQLDAIAWLFNIRCSDVEFNPVVISYAVIYPESVNLFFDLRKVDENLEKALSPMVSFKSYDKFGHELRKISSENRKVLVDSASVSLFIVEQLGNNQNIVFGETAVTLMKALKNKTEIQGFKACHIRDGVAMVKFLTWLDETVPKGGVTEISASNTLARFRGENDKFKGLSFGTISAFGEHGAIIHYTADEKSDVELKMGGIYLVDSGGQYLDGTTDITRTVAFGQPTQSEKRFFTLVLRGFIDLATARFPQGTAGKQLDTIARKPLWDAGVNYAHGTGHGVGSYLNVHEGPHAISYYRCVGVPLEPGMVTSNEPGYYSGGTYGIRIENLIYVVNDSVKGFLKFENLTICPIDQKLVDKNLLTKDELTYLNDYHNLCYKTLSPLLSEKEKTWLKTATQKI
jgi:Xaa-Pro aminopeptidase